jgi:hypothetical protein
MEAPHKIELGINPEARPGPDGAELAWRAYIRAEQERAPVRQTPAPEMGPGPEDASRERLARGTAYAEFEVQPDTGEVLVKIIDGETGKIIRTVPPDELMEAVRSGQEWTRLWRIYI